MKKKVSFASNRPSQTVAKNVDNWVENREVDILPLEKAEPTKRLTIDVSIPLHTRIKSQCAMRDEVMADVIRDLLERHFPAGQGAGQGARS